MITGPCPYCGASLINYLPEDRQLPCFERIECPSCLGALWIRYSRAMPCVFTIAGFEATHTIDEVTRRITPNSEERARMDRNYRLITGADND